MDFRYAQFCPLTRAAEILGERWTILVLRELFLGPKRFSELRAALNGVSPSVLADRLGKLEERGIVARRELPPPAASAVYELDEAGRALRPLLVELTRWGIRFLGVPGPSDMFRPEWLLLGLQVFARTCATNAVGAHLHVKGGAESVDIYVRGGDAGTTVSRTPLPHDVSISAPPMELLMFVSGFAAAGSADAPPALRIEGSIDVAQRIPALFDFRPTPAPAHASPEISTTDPTPAGCLVRGGPKPAATRSRKTQGATGS